MTGTGTQLYLATSCSLYFPNISKRRQDITETDRQIDNMITGPHNEDKHQSCILILEDRCCKGLKALPFFMYCRSTSVISSWKKKSFEFYLNQIAARTLLNEL